MPYILQTSWVAIGEMDMSDLASLECRSLSRTISQLRIRCKRQPGLPHWQVLPSLEMHVLFLSCEKLAPCSSRKHICLSSQVCKPPIMLKDTQLVEDRIKTFMILLSIIKYLCIQSLFRYLLVLYNTYLLPFLHQSQVISTRHQYGNPPCSPLHNSGG